MVTPYGRSVMAKRGRHGPLGLALAEPVHDVDDLLHVESLHGCLRTVVTVRKLRRWQRTQSARWYIPSEPPGKSSPRNPVPYRAAQVVHTGRRTLVHSPRRSLVQYSPVRDSSRTQSLAIRLEKHLPYVRKRTPRKKSQSSFIAAYRMRTIPIFQACSISTPTTSHYISSLALFKPRLIVVNSLGPRIASCKHFMPRWGL